MKIEVNNPVPVVRAAPKLIQLANGDIVAMATDNVGFYVQSASAPFGTPYQAAPGLPVTDFEGTVSLGND